MSDNAFKKERSANLISGILLIILAILLWWQSESYPVLDEGYPGPNLFPRIIAIGLGLIGMVLLFSNFKKKPDHAFSDLDLRSAGVLRPLLAVILVIAFPYLSPLIGFPSTLLIVTILMGFVFQLKWWKAVVTGVITVGFVYLIFSQLLGVLF